MPGALVFGAAASDRVSIAAAAAINDLDPFTYIGWFNPSSLGTNRQLVDKAAAGNVGKVFGADGTDSSKLQFRVSRATTATNYSSATGVVVINTWQLFALVFDSTLGAGLKCKFYKGTLSAPAALQTATVAAEGAGTLTSEATSPLLIGNVVGLTIAFVGSIAPVAVFNVALSLADIQSWQQRPRVTVGANVAKMFVRPGKNGADCIEYTGLTPTVTGPTQGDGPGLDQGDLTWQRDTASGLLTMAA